MTAKFKFGATREVTVDANQSINAAYTSSVRNVLGAPEKVQFVKNGAVLSGDYQLASGDTITVEKAAADKGC